ncbi:hypothetical protein NURINAE_00853 [Candidatus Nitrosacidococcus sp. I8]|nr:hypothetical protein NURINAE_00853 [Candidatus Nitrosacidococcus sp. I8]
MKLRESKLGGITFISTFDELSNKSQNIVTAFEVCEHLYSYELESFIKESNRVLQDNGILIISVPIMYGLSLLPKVLNRIFLFRKFEYSFFEFLKSLFGLTIDRPSNPKPTHKGFDFRELKKYISRQYQIESMHYSPFPQLPWWLNSQIFFIFKKNI